MKLRIWRAFWGITLASGIAATVVLLRLPSDGGLSAQRLLALGAMAALLAGLAAAGILLLFRAPGIERWERWSRGGRFLVGCLALATALVLLPPTLLDWLRTLFRDTQEFRYRAYAERLAPPVYWLALTGVALLAVLLIAHRRDLSRAFAAVSGELRPWGWIWLGLALLAGLVALTGLWKPLDDVLGSWGNPAVPLLEWQVALAVLLAVPLTWLAGKVRGRRAELLIGFTIWLIAAVLWASTPLVPGYFATPGRAPNFEIYPFSDAATYDTYAQSVLIGNGFMGDAIPQRAFYIVFLAGLHLLAGQDYLKVIFLQTLVLALLPVLVYQIGRELHGRPAGILAALFVILRELTAIRAAPFTGNITYSKLYFSELPTALCLAAFTLFAIRWVKRRGERSLAPLLAGGFLGMAMLIRTQSFAVLPPVLVLSLLAYRPWSWKGWLRGAALLGVGLVACVAPWLARNWSVAGGLTFDNSMSQTMVLAQRYNNINFDDVIPKEKGESEAQYSSRLMRMALQGISRDPAGSAWLISSHFMNNEIANGLLLPVRFQLGSPKELIWPETNFWQNWDRTLTGPQALLVLAFLGLLAAGLTGATCRSGWMGLAPLLGGMVYNLGTAVFRSSGDRFLAPVDWTVLLLYAIGIAQVGAWMAAGAGLRCTPEMASGETAAVRRPSLPLGSIALAALAFLLVGATLPLAERVFPVRYPQETRAQLAAQLAGSLARAKDAQKADALRRLLDSPNAILAKGEALYPRFYKAGESEPRTGKTGYAGLEFARLVFPMIGTENKLVVLPITQAPKVANASEVLVVGCQDHLYLRAMLVAVRDGPVYFANHEISECK